MVRRWTVKISSAKNLQYRSTVASRAKTHFLFLFFVRLAVTENGGLLDTFVNFCVSVSSVTEHFCRVWLKSRENNKEHDRKRPTAGSTVIFIVPFFNFVFVSYVYWPLAALAITYSLNNNKEINILFFL